MTETNGRPGDGSSSGCITRGIALVSNNVDSLNIDGMCVECGQQRKRAEWVGVSCTVWKIVMHGAGRSCLTPVSSALS